MLLSSGTDDSSESLYQWPTRADVIRGDYYWLVKNCEHWINGTPGTHTWLSVSPWPNAASVPYRIGKHMYVLINSTNTNSLQGIRPDSMQDTDTYDTILSSIDLQKL